MSENQFDEAAAKAAGVVTEEPIFNDYWGFSDVIKHYLPDGVQYFEIQKMNEGQKSEYQRNTRSDITVARQSGDAKLKSDPAGERKALLMASVVGWYMLKKGPSGEAVEVNFNKTAGPESFEKWLAIADPVIVEGLEKAVRKHNPWLLAEMSVEDIDREIENLKEMREVAVKREAGE